MRGGARHKNSVNLFLVFLVFLIFLVFIYAGQLASSNTATLSQLPLSRILTLGMDVPEAWLVQPIVARYNSLLIFQPPPLLYLTSPLLVSLPRFVQTNSTQHRYDLDNIKLEDLGDEKVLTAIFELEYILVEGAHPSTPTAVPHIHPLHPLTKHLFTSHPT